MRRTQVQNEFMVDMVVLAAGKGTRMNRPKNKMFQPVNGVPILYRTLYQLNQMPVIRRLIAVVKMEERQEFESLLQRYGELEKVKAVVEGGRERHDSVRHGLTYILENPLSEIVMTHDGARPFVTEKLIKRLVNSIEEGHIAVPAIKISETTREKGLHGATRIVDRNRLYLTQTPQTFFKNSIQDCFMADGQVKKQLTDEAGYFESLGRPVTLVEGDKRNLKITTPEDIAWAEYLLANNKELRIEHFDGK